MLWVALAVVIWNVVFDSCIDAGMMAEYLRRQAFFEQGRGPRAEVDAVMDAAIRGGVYEATAWAGGVAVAGLAAVWYAGRRADRCNQN
jgi:hypothetical protein